MSPWLLSFTVSVVIVAQTQPDAAPASRAAKIRVAVKKLSSRDFATREHAYQFLWKQGLAAEPALRRAAKEGDGETRLRARKLLLDFDYGVLPGADPGTIARIRDFRDGDAVDRERALKQFVDAKQFDVIERLIRLESDAGVRHQLLVRLFQHDETVKRFIELDRVETLIAAVGKDQDEDWRRSVAVDLVFAAKSVASYAENGKLGALLKLIQQEKQADIRLKMLSAVCRPDVSGSVIEKKHLDFLLDALRAEPDTKVRGDLFSQIVGNTKAGQAIVTNKQLDTVMNFIKDDVHADKRHLVFAALFRSQPIAQALLQDGGLDRVKELAADEEDAASRGRLLAVILSSSAFRQALPREKLAEAAVELAKGETDPKARREFLQALLSNYSVVYALSSSNNLKAMWDLIKSDDDAKWKPEAIALLLRSHYTMRMLQREKEEAKWLLQLIRETKALATREQLLQYLLGNYQAHESLIKDGHFDALLELAVALPDQSRGRIVGSFLSSRSVAQHLTAQERLVLFVEIPQKEMHEPARREYLAGVFRNYTAMSELIKAGHYQTFRELIANDSDPVRRAALFGDFLAGRDVLAELDKQGHSGELLEHAELQNEEAQKQFLSRMFRNHGAIGLLIDKGHYEKLASIAKRNDGEFLDEMLSIPKVVEYLAEKKQLKVLFDFAANGADDSARRNLVRNILYNQQLMKKLIDAGQFDPIFAMVRSERDAAWRGSLLGPALSSPEILKHLAAKKKLATVFDLIQRETVPQVRQQILSQLASRSDAVSILIDHGQLPTLLQMIKKHTAGRYRGDLLGRVLVSAKTLQHLKAKGQESLLLSFTEDDDSQAVEYYLTRIFSYSNAVGVLIDAGHYDALYRLATASGTAKVRATRISQLFANAKALQQMLGRQQLSAVLDLARNVDDADARRTYLQSFCRNEVFVNQLIQRKLFDELVEICKLDPDRKVQQRHLATLLMSGNATDELAKLAQLDSIVKNAVDDADGNAQRTWLSSLLTRSEAVQALIKHGHFETVLAVAEKRLTGTTKTSVFQSLLSNPKAVDYFAASGKIDFLWELLDGVSHRSQRPYMVSRFASSARLMKAIVEKGQLDRLLDEVKNAQSSSMRSSLLASILFSTGTLDALAANDKLAIVFERVTQDGTDTLAHRCVQAFAYTPANRRHLANSKVAAEFLAVLKKEDERYLSSYTYQLLSDTYLRRKWVETGQVDALKAIIAMVPQEARRRAFRQQLLFSPSGVLGALLRRGDAEEAEKLAVESEDDAGLSAYVTMQVTRGKLAERIAVTREAYDKDSKPADARLLVYLHRAAGDLSAAVAIAKSLDDPQLLRPLYVEQQAWREAAALEAQAHQAAPVAASTFFVDTPDSLRIEQLGMLAAYYRRARMTDEFESTIKAIQDFAGTHKDNEDLVWNATEALLLNDRFDKGLELARLSRIEKAFTLLTYRHDYDSAMALVGLGTAVVPDRAWYDALAIDGKSDQEKKLNRFKFAIRIARTRSHLGQMAEAERILKVLEQVASSAPTTSGSPTSQQYSEQLAAGLFQMGLRERAWAVAASSMSPSTNYPPNVLNYMYGTREVEADAWWLFFRDKFPEEAPVACFNRVYLALYPAEDESADAYSKTFEAAMAFGASVTSDAQRTLYWRGLGETCRLRGLNDKAIECLQKTVGGTTDTSRTIATLQVKEGRWQDAAETYRRIWENDHDQVGALYLAGDALERAGDHRKGKAWKDEADSLAIRSRTRHTLAVDLADRGLMDEAAAQWEMLLKTAPLESWELNDAARRLGDYCLNSNPKRAADLWGHYVLGDLRPAYWFLKDDSYLRMPFVIHKARATQAIKDGELERAERELDIAHAAAPNDTRIAEELVPVLDQAEHKPLADRLASKLIGHYQEMSNRYPKSAYFHNNLAWVAARCHRELDLAMKHAVQATTIEPSNGSYVDTLAEVHFQLGDRAAAVRESERAVRLSPFQSSLRAQLARFRKDAMPGS